MSARTHPRLVGAFVLGAVALVLAAIVFLSGKGFFAPRDRFAVYFPGSVKGLGPGSEVTFRGVKIGEVVDVSPFLTGKPDPLIQIEVVVELYSGVTEVPEGVANPFEGLSTAEFAQALIDRGIRGRLMSGSLLTGQKYIEFDFAPDEPARFAGISRQYPELPTTPTAMEKLGKRFDRFFEKLAELPLDEMLEDVRQAIHAVREIMESEDLRGALAGARRAAEQLEPTLKKARAALDDAQELFRTLDSEVGEIGGEARQTMAEVRERLAGAESALEALETTLRGADEARVDLSQTLVELQRTSRALRNLVDYIQTHPEAVLQGKEKEKK